MKLFFLSIIAAIILSGCASTDILYTSPMSKNIKEDEQGHYFYENDTIKVTYTFWAERGIMGMVIENKLEVPLYIDWKKSAYVDKKTKVNYYSENLSTKSVSAWANAPYLYRSIYDWSHWYPVNLGVSVSAGIIEKQERVSFIPPHTQSAWNPFNLIVARTINMKKDSTEYVKVVGRNKEIKVQVVKASRDNTNIYFSNFLTYSTKENFENEKYVDNQFYINKIIRISGGGGNAFKDAKCFYITEYDN